MENEIINKLKKNEGEILVVKLEGKLADKASDVNLIKIKKIGYELGYSYISINKSKLNDKDTGIRKDVPLVHTS